MGYQALRGGRVVFQPINRPSSTEWDSALSAMEFVLKLEKEVQQVQQINCDVIGLMIVNLVCLYFISGIVGITQSRQHPQRCPHD